MIDPSFIPFILIGGGVLFLFVLTRMPFNIFYL